MDGSLLADGKTPSDYDYNVAVTREVVEYAHARGVTVEGELGTLGGIEDGVGSGEVHLTDPDQARRLRRSDRHRRAGRRDRHQPRRLQVQPAAGWRDAGDGPDRGDPPPPARHAHGHARLLQRAGRVDRADQRRRRLDEADLRRSGRGDPAGHPQRGAEGQRRHRRTAGDHRRAARGGQRARRRISIRARSPRRCARACGTSWPNGCASSGRPATPAIISR